MLKNIARNLALTITLLTTFSFLAACTKKAEKLDYGLEVKDTLRINISTEPPSLDWNKSTDTTSAEIQFNIMSSLVEYDLNDPELKLKPNLALNWEPSNKATKWKFKLREGVKWTDGVEFEAQHVVDGWERLLNPATASEYAYFIYAVKNAKSYNEGKLKDFSQVGVKATGKYELTVELDKPMGYFPMLLTHHSTMPLRKDVVAKFGDKWTDPANIQTLGPFKLKVWEHDKAMVLERNDEFWGEKAKVKAVLAYIINDQSTAINLFNSKKVDFVPELPSTELDNLRKKKEFKEEGNLTIYYYGFNTKKAPLDNLKVRQALSMAIDKDQIVKMINGGQTPLYGWFPKGMFGYTDNVGLRFDPEKAKALLKEAGYDDPTKLPKITLGFNTNENHKRIAENVQAQLKTNLGVQIELKNEEWKVYLKSLQTDAPHIYRMGWAADYPDPDNFINLMTSYSENNHTGWKNTKFDKLVEEGASETNPDKRRGLYNEAQKLLAEADAPVLPIYSGVSHMLISDRVQNFPVNKMARRIYSEVTLSGEGSALK